MQTCAPPGQYEWCPLKLGLSQTTTKSVTGQGSLRATKGSPLQSPPFLLSCPQEGHQVVEKPNKGYLYWWIQGISALFNPPLLTERPFWPLAYLEPLLSIPFCSNIYI